MLTDKVFKKSAIPCACPKFSVTQSAMWKAGLCLGSKQENDRGSALMMMMKMMMMTNITWWWWR